jgi:acyl-CoA synthetase (AMP-forming)/AMP-acid ligase II
VLQVSQTVFFIVSSSRCRSSGTSGTPKAVCLPHSALVANTIQASFLLHDRMNKPLLDGRKEHPEGKGWYDTAGQGTSKGSLLGRVKRRLSLGAEGLESKNRGRPEFHQDVLPQFHCYGLLVTFVALHTVRCRGTHFRGATLTSLSRPRRASCCRASTCAPFSPSCRSAR